MAFNFDFNEEDSIFELAFDVIFNDCNTHKISLTESEKRLKVLVQSLEDGNVPRYLIYPDVIISLKYYFDYEFIFCSDCDHVSTAVFEKKFACGYKNFQMLISALLRVDIYRTVLDKHDIKAIPTIWKIQNLIELTWKNDCRFGDSFNNELYDHKKKIGALDISILLKFIGIDSKILEFHNFNNDYDEKKRMSDCLWQYFSTNQNAVFPVIMQNERHSKLVVGVQSSSVKNSALRQFVALEAAVSQYKMNCLLDSYTYTNALERQFLCSLERENKNIYQILIIDGIL